MTSSHLEDSSKFVGYAACSYQQEEALIAKTRAENPDMPKHELLRKVYASEEYKKLMDEESN